MNNDTLKIKIIPGSVRESRFSDKAASWIAQELEKHEGIEVEILDLRDYEMPFFNEPVSPAYKKEPFSNEAVARFTKKIAEGDAFVIVTPEYNHSIPGVLKNAIDWVYPEWNIKPISFVSYGSVGGARAVEHLRLIAIELQMVPLRESVHFNGEQYFPVAGGKTSADELFASHGASAERMVTKLIWWGHLLKNSRN